MADDDASARVADPREHLDLDQLADLAENLLPAEQTELARTHLQTCAACRDQRDELAELSALLSSTAAPELPDAVAQRLDDALAAEQVRRTLAPSTVSGPAPARTTLGSFEPDPRAGLKGLGRLRAWQTALVAATLAALVGFGGYVASASSGLNEPVAAAPAYVHSDELGTDAAALARKDGLDAYPFTITWRCANRLVTGRVTGLIPAYVDGSRALLVYSRRGGQSLVTVVTGCPGTGAQAGQSVKLPG